jgi:hypothetical protein
MVRRSAEVALERARALCSREKSQPCLVRARVGSADCAAGRQALLIAPWGPFQATLSVW